MDKSSTTDGASGDVNGILSGRTSPLNGVETDPTGAGSSTGSGGVNNVPLAGQHFRKLNGASVGATGAADEAARGGGATPAGLSTRVKGSPVSTATAAAVRNGAPTNAGGGPGHQRSASPRGFPDMGPAGRGGDGEDRTFDTHGGSGGDGVGGVGNAYGMGAGGVQHHQQQQQQQHRDSGAYGGRGAAGGDFVGAMGALSLGPGGSGGGGGKGLHYGGGGMHQLAGRGDLYGNHNVMDASRVGGGLHGGIMPPSPYNGPQMSPYGGPQVPHTALMGSIPPLTPELHSASMMGYHLVRSCGHKTSSRNSCGGLCSSPLALFVSSSRLFVTSGASGFVGD